MGIYSHRNRLGKLYCSSIDFVSRLRLRLRLLHRSASSILCYTIKLTNFTLTLVFGKPLSLLAAFKQLYMLLHIDIRHVIAIYGFNLIAMMLGVACLFVGPFRWAPIAIGLVAMKDKA